MRAFLRRSAGGSRIPRAVAAGDGCFVHLGDTCCWGRCLAAAPRLSEAVILVKPQFEVGRGNVGKGGIVRDPEAHQQAVEKVAACVESFGWQVVESIPSPITGAEGNQEFLLYARCARGFGVDRAREDPWRGSGLFRTAAAPVHWDRMTHVAIVCKPQKEELARILPELIAWLRKHGYEPLLRPGGRRVLPGRAGHRSRRDAASCTGAGHCPWRRRHAALRGAHLCRDGHADPEREPGIPRLSYRDSPGRSLHDP